MNYDREEDDCLFFKRNISTQACYWHFISQRMYVSCPKVGHICTHVDPLQAACASVTFRKIKNDNQAQAKSTSMED